MDMWKYLAQVKMISLYNLEIRVKYSVLCEYSSFKMLSVVGSNKYGLLTVKLAEPVKYEVGLSLSLGGLMVNEMYYFTTYYLQCCLFLSKIWESYSSI